jgi:hypothetical protein
MNRFFLAFAAVLTSGIFAFSYLKEWAFIQLGRQDLALNPTAEIIYPYFHQSPELYLRVTLIFGIVFLILFIASVYFVFKKNEKKIFFTFILTMFAILALMVNGAIK